MINRKKNEFDQISKIVEEKNFDELFKLTDNGVFSIALHQILISIYTKNQDSLNEQQLNLFLCMHIENAGQADHILSFLQEWYPQYQNRIVSALEEIGAQESAIIIKKAIKLLPKDGSWFFDKATVETQNLMDRYDGEFSDYPDGFMRDLYRKYADLNMTQINKV